MVTSCLFNPRADRRNQNGRDVVDSNGAAAMVLRASHRGVPSLAASLRLDHRIILLGGVAMTREEIERLADQLIEPYGENISRRTRAADALLALLDKRDRLEQLRSGYENQIASLDKHSV